MRIFSNKIIFNTVFNLLLFLFLFIGLQNSTNKTKINLLINETINSADFRIVPFLETIYEVENKGYVRLSYDYALNGFRVRYEKRF